MKKLVLLSALVGLGCAANAQSYFFTASLSGANEIPANSSPAVGFATVTLNLNNPLDNSDDTYSYSVSYSGLTGNSTAAHIHGPATTAATAGVIVPLLINSGATAGNFSGANIVLSTAAATALENALLTQTANVSLGYVNIHSTAFPGGELRGQLVQVAVVPEVDSALIVGAALGLGAIVWRRRQA